eukprot:7779951-Pyramimonas_sp.AAC.1
MWSVVSSRLSRAHLSTQVTGWNSEPSGDNEAGPAAASEALAAACAPVATDLKNLKEIAASRGAASIAQPGDDAAIAALGAPRVSQQQLEAEIEGADRLCRALLQRAQ